MQLSRHSAPNPREVELSAGWLAIRLNEIVRGIAKSDLSKQSVLFADSLMSRIASETNYPSRDNALRKAGRRIEEIITNLVFPYLEVNSLSIQNWSDRCISALSTFERSPHGKILDLDVPRLRTILDAAVDSVELRFPDRWGTVSSVLEGDLNLRLKIKPKFKTELSFLLRDSLTEYKKYCLGKASESLCEEIVKSYMEDELHGGLDSMSLREAAYAVSRHPAYLDTAGAILFDRRSGHLSLGEPKVDLIGRGFLIELRRSVHGIRTAGIITQFSNVDRMIPNLFLDYQEGLSQIEQDKLVAFSLWSIGSELEDRIKAAENRDDSGIDPSAVRSLATMFVAHHFFMKSHEWLKEALEKELGSGVAFQQLPPSSHPIGLVGELSKEEVFGENARDLMNGIVYQAAREKRQARQVSHQTRAVALGTLRGSVNGLAGVVLSGINNAVENFNSDDGSSKKLEEALSVDWLTRESFNLLLRNEGSLIKMSDVSPDIFGWLRRLYPVLHKIPNPLKP